MGNNVLEFINVYNPHFYIAVGLSVFNGFLLCILGYKFLQIIQLTGYRLRGFYSWTRQTKGNYLIRITMLGLLSFSCMLAMNFTLEAMKISSYYSYISLVFYLYFTVYFAAKIRGGVSENKTPLKYTNRMNRLMGTLMLFGTLTTFLLFYLGWLPNDRYAQATSLIGLTPIALLFLVPMAYYANWPFEAMHQQNFIRKVRKKIKTLERDKVLFKIGITGSYGKTSVKNILETILSEKYSVCASPASFNTPMGLTKTVLRHLHNEHNVLICEMGARRKNDIKKLCRIVRPDISILTAIGTAHLETFGTVDDIKTAKFEIMRALPSLGLGIFNGESEGAKELFEKAVTEKVLTGFDKNYFVFAKNISVCDNGTTFTLCLDGGEYKATTKLLGKHNIENILMAVAVAVRLRVPAKDIVNGIAKLTPSKHRMELISGGKNGITVLDNSYNSNARGAEMALEVLSLFKGDRFVATPGMVELGNQQFEINKNFGKQIAVMAKGCFVINEINRKALLEGLKEGGMKDENIYICENLEEAREKFAEILKPGSVILLENDLPDSYV